MLSGGAMKLSVQALAKVQSGGYNAKWMDLGPLPIIQQTDR